MKPKPHHPNSGHECHFREDAARHFTGEIFVAGFESHLKECPACQEVGAVIQRLRSLPPEEPSENLTASILAAIQQPETSIVRVRFHRWAAAAIVIMSLAAMSVWQIGKKPVESISLNHPQPALVNPADQSVQEALNWFCRTQEANGSWSPARWGGDPRFEVALTALPMLAILSADTKTTPEHAKAIDKAKRYLQSTCDTRGRFGPQFYGSSYSQGIATLALLTCYKNKPDAETKRQLDHALEVIMSQQQANGSWGAGATAQSDLTITLWQLEALKMAAELGWQDVHPHLSIGTKWIANHSNNSHAILDVHRPAAVDYFTIYFATTRLKEASDESSRDQLSSIRHTLLRKQVQRGTDSGSWTPDDRWGMAGGRLYTTALASLSLH